MTLREELTIASGVADVYYRLIRIELLLTPPLSSGTRTG